MGAQVGYSKYVKYVGRLMWRIEFQSKGITPDTATLPVVYTLYYQSPDPRVVSFTATAEGTINGSKHGGELAFPRGKLIEVLQVRRDISLAFGSGIEVTVKGRLSGTVVRGGLKLGKGKQLPPIDLVCEGTHVLPPRPYRKPPKPGAVSNKKKPPKSGSGSGLEHGETKPKIIPAPGKKGEKPTPGSWSGIITPGGEIELPKVPGNSGSNIVEWKSEGGGDAPTTRFVIERSEDDGEWLEIAAGTHQTISDPYIQPGHYYRYRVKAQGPGGDSDWAYTGATYTTPKAPTGVALVRDNEEVTITWVNQGVGDYRTQLIAKFAGTSGIEREIDIEKNATKCELSDLSMHKSWDIYLRHVVSLGEETIFGESSEKIMLPRFSAPNAPDMLTPQNIWVTSSTVSVPVSWRHNPTDYSKQTQFQLRIKDPYSGEWLERRENSSVEFRVRNETEITLEDFPFNAPHVSVCEWQVRTAGCFEHVFSPWSESAFIRIDPTASSSITEPKYGDTVTSTAIAVTGKSNAVLPFTWSIDLVKDGKILATRGGRATTDKTFTVEFTGLEDGQYYELRPSAGSVIPTPGIATPFKVQLAAIDAPTVTPAWDSERGSVQVTIGNKPDHTENREIARREGDGDWLPIAVNQPVNMAFSDYTPQLAHRIEYRATTVNQAGNVTYGYGRLEPKIRHVYLTSEDGVVWVKAAWNPTHTRQLGLAHTNKQYFLGRSKPVFLAGKETTRVMQVSATILPDEADRELARWDKLATYPKPVLYRDPSGLYTWVAVSDVQLEYLRTQRCWQVSCTCTEVEYRR